MSTQSIAIAGASDVAKYLIEELVHSNPNTPPRITVLTRSLSNRPWFTSNPHITLRVTDYTQSSILHILNESSATVLFSFLHSNDPGFYNTAHEAMLAACKASERCRRFVPSDHGGDIERFPGLPRFYEPTHQAFREEFLENETGVEWTVVNNGWFMDYFVQGSEVDPTVVSYTSLSEKNVSEETVSSEKSDTGCVEDRRIDTSRVRSYMKPLPGVWPLDLDTFSVTLLGTGEEPIAWTAARDVARALVKLLDAPVGTWEKHTYVVGQVGTWNEAIGIVERFFGRKLNITKRSTEEISENVAKADSFVSPRGAVAAMDEWNVSGASAVPMDKVLEQREKFFSGVEFRDIETLLRDAFEKDSQQIV